MVLQSMPAFKRTQSDERASRSRLGEGNQRYRRRAVLAPAVGSDTGKTMIFSA
jgi:hypothetical protein